MSHVLQRLSPLEVEKHGPIAAAQLFGVDSVKDCAHSGIIGNPVWKILPGLSGCS